MPSQETFCELRALPSWKTALLSAAGGVLALVSVLFPWWSTSEGGTIFLFNSTSYLEYFYTTNGQPVSFNWGSFPSGYNSYVPDRLWTALFGWHLLLVAVLAAGILGLLAVRKPSAAAVASALLIACIVVFLSDLVREVSAPSALIILNGRILDYNLNSVSVGLALGFYFAVAAAILLAISAFSG